MITITSIVLVWHRITLIQLRRSSILTRRSKLYKFIITINWTSRRWKCACLSLTRIIIFSFWRSSRPLRSENWFPSKRRWTWTRKSRLMKMKIKVISHTRNVFMVKTRSLRLWCSKTSINRRWCTLNLTLSTIKTTWTSMSSSKNKTGISSRQLASLTVSRWCPGSANTSRSCKWTTFRISWRRS